MTTELATITAYDEFREKVGDVKLACDFIPNVSTDDGYEKSKRVSLDVGKILTAIDKARKIEKAESLATGKRIDSEAKTLVAELEGFQSAHKLAYKNLDQAKKDRETARKAGLELRCEEIEGLPFALHEMDSGAVQCALEGLIADECLDFYEYTERALKSRNVSRDALSAMFSTKLQQEKDAKELKELQAKSAEADKIIADAKLVALGESQAAAKQKQADEIEARQEATRLADREHVSGIRTATKNDLMGCGIDEAHAKDIVLAIHNGRIANLTINY